MKSSFDKQVDEWLALPEAERIAIMSERKPRGITSDPVIDELVDSPDYITMFGDLLINKEI